jgi:hypothetical protein
MSQIERPTADNPFTAWREKEDRIDY